MIRDLVDIAIDMVREERLEEVAERAEKNAEERLLDLLMPPQPEASESAERTREKLREKLRAGKLDDRMVEVDVRERGPTFEISTNTGIEEMDVNLKDVLPGPVRPAYAQAQNARRRSRRLPGAGRRAEADRHGSGDARGAGPRGAQRHRLPGRDRQDRRARGRPWPGRQPRRRAARYFAHRGRHHGQHAPRVCADRSYSVHRRRARSTSPSRAI